MALTETFGGVCALAAENVWVVPKLGIAELGCASTLCARACVYVCMYMYVIVCVFFVPSL